ncbi:molybdenum cofactor guanylyltransferase [Verrucomicrobiota bacterium]
MDEIIKIPGMLMVGAAGRNAGKTEFACSLIRMFSKEREIVGIKVTTITRKDGSCPRGGAGCGVCSSLDGNYCITDEADAPREKDTARLLAAGASRVYWLRVMKSHLEQGMSALLDIAGRDSVTICESNSLRRVVEPGLFLMVKEKGSEKYKESAEAVKKYADRVVLSNGKGFDTDIKDIGFVGDKWALKEKATAIVMAGGASKRMQKDKSMLMVDGRPLIANICNQLAGNFDQILVSANDQNKYTFLGFDVIPDKTPDNGPLMGIASALEASVNALNFIAACDIPDVDMVLTRQMLREAEDYDVVVPRTSGDKIEPLFAVYRKSVLKAMQSALLSNERRVGAVLDVCRVKYIDLPEARRPLNLNTMDDYQEYVGRGGGRRNIRYPTRNIQG